jgi:tetratricopeptide (TPR) repeat protein
MKTLKITSTLFTAMLALFFFACQPSEKKADTTSTENLDFTYTTQSKEALQQFQEGQTIFELGDRERARPYFDKAIELDPDFAVAYVYRAWCRRSAQEYNAFTKMANEKNKNLSEAEQLMVELNNGYATNDVTKRISVGKTMVEKYPAIARGHLILGLAYKDSRDIMNARKNFAKAIELRPDWISGYRAMGESYLFDEPKDLAQAEENMEKLVALMPNESRTHIMMGDVYRAQQNLEKALASFQKAASLAPNDEQVYAKTGHVNLYLGNYEEARKDYEKSKTLSNYPANSLNDIAFTYLYEGRHDEGLAYLKNQVSSLENTGLAPDELMGSKINMLDKCMWTAFYLGDAAETKALLAQIQPLDLERTKSANSDEQMMIYKARMNFKEGMIALLEGNLKLAKEKAVAQKADLATINNPSKLEEYYLLQGKIAMEEGKYADAVAQLKKANMGNMYHKYMLAMANEKAGNEAEATQLLKDISAYRFVDLESALVRNDVLTMLPSKS